MDEVYTQQIRSWTSLLSRNAATSWFVEACDCRIRLLLDCLHYYWHRYNCLCCYLPVCRAFAIVEMLYHLFLCLTLSFLMAFINIGILLLCYKQLLPFCPPWERDPSIVALAQVSVFFFILIKGF